MALWFYDNPTAPDVDPALISVERVYCVHVDRLSQVQLTTLFLWASVEPAGLVVGGTLSRELWSTWDAQFRSAFERAHLPSFGC
jgi:hypothetical protein